MNDKAAKKLAEGELARKGRALQSIKEILGLTDETYQAWLNSMTEHERATHDAEVERYMVTLSSLAILFTVQVLRWHLQRSIHPSLAQRGWAIYIIRSCNDCDGQVAPRRR